MSKNPFRTFEYVITDKLQDEVAHYTILSTTLRTKYILGDYLPETMRHKDFKNYKVWIRVLNDSLEILERNSWYYTALATNRATADQLANDYAELGKTWTEWVNLSTDTTFIDNYIRLDQDIADKLSMESSNQ